MSQIPWRSLDDLWTNGIYSSNRGHREFKKVPISFYLLVFQSSSDIIQPIVFGQLFCSITFELNFNYCSFRKAIPLCKNDGIYVRDIQSGAVSSIPHFHRYRVRCIFKTSNFENYFIMTLSYFSAGPSCDGSTVISTEGIWRIVGQGTQWGSGRYS